MPMLYLGIGMLAFGALIVAIGLVVRNKAKKILAAPLRRTAEAAGASGPASVEGAVRTQGPIYAPCSGQPCVYFTLKIEKKVKEKHGTQTQVKWKTMSEQHQGSLFAIDDGSGPVAVNALEPLDADLQQTYQGPPKGPITVPPSPHEEVLEYRVTERIIAADARLFALGQLDRGQLVKPAKGKMIVSTRGRDALLGSTKRLATGLFAFGSVVAVAGVPIMILRPGEAKPCGELKDTVSACYVHTEPTMIETPQPDGSKKMEPNRKAEIAWQVTKPGKYEVTVRQDGKKGKSYPRVGVDDSIGLPMNFGVNMGFGANAATQITSKTANLKPGTYKVTVWTEANAPDKQIIEIKPYVGDNKEASR